MGGKCKYNQNHGPGALILGGEMCLSRIGKVSARAQPGLLAEQSMQRDHWMSQSVQGRRPVLASRNCTAGHSKESIC